MSEYEYATTCGLLEWNDDPPAPPKRPEGKGWRLVFCCPDPGGADQDEDQKGLITMVWTWERIVPPEPVT